MSQATALLANAESSITSGDWDQALAQLEQVKQSEPNEPDVYRKLAHVQSVRGKFRSVIATYVELVGVLVENEELSEAEKVIGTVLALNPECEEAREQRIEIERKRGNVDRAVYLARELARLCIEQGDGDRSIRLLKEAQGEQPENLDISLELAEMYVSHGQIQDGANQYRKVANAFQEAGNIAKAAESYRRMKVVQSDDPDVLLTLGRLYTELGKLDEAEQEFRSVLRHDLEHQDALLELGLVCQLKGRFRSGLLAFNKVLQNNPKLPRAMRKLGELNLSMGKQDEAVQHFLEAAQAYLEAEEREQAVETFQLVLGVEENNAQAQQGLTNLGAPLDPKPFEPPLPPTPPEEEPTPEAGPVSASSLGEMPPPANPPEEEEEEEEDKKETSKRPTSKLTGLAAKKPASAKARRKGLVSGGLGLRKGLVAPSAGGGGKPMLGGKPTLGGSGGTPRAGLRRPGLGMKGGPGEKPMLGMKPTLDRRRPARDPEPEPPEPMEEEVAEAEENVFDDDGSATQMEPIFDDEGDQGTSDGDIAFDDGLDAAANELFDNDADSAFGEGLAESLFDDSETAPQPSRQAVAPQPAEDEGHDLFGDTGDDGDDLFSMGGEGGLFDDEGGGDDLFGDQGMGSGSLFDDESKDEGEDLFGALEEPEQEAAEPAARGKEPQQSEEDLFPDDGFDNLFDEEPSVDKNSTSDTIGSLAGEAPAAPEQESVEEDSAFDSLFSEPAEEEDVEVPGDDLFATSVDQPEPRQEEPADSGLFAESSSDESDLFGEDLFPSAAEEPAPPEAQAESSPDEDDLFGSDDLFAGADEPAGGLEEEAPGEDAGLFAEAPAQQDDDDLFGGGLFDEPAEEKQAAPPEEDSSDDDFDLFGEPAEEQAQEQPADDLFGGFDSEPADDSEPLPQEESLGGSDDGGLFGGEASGDDLFGSDPEPAEDLFSQPQSETDLFGSGDEDDSSDLFGSSETEASPALEETSIDHGPPQESDDLFGGAPPEAAEEPSDDGGSLFDIPAPDAEGSLFDEPEPPQPESDDLFGSTADDMFAEAAAPTEEAGFEGAEDEGGLFDSVQTDEHEEASPLGLDLPMPGDEPQPVEEVASSVPAEGDDLFGEPLMEAPAEPEMEDPAEDALTIDKLRAEEMARVVDVEQEEPADSEEFMKLLELTLPKSEEEAQVVEEEPDEELFVPVAEPEALSPETASPDGEESLFDSPEVSDEPGGLFDEPQENLFDAPPEPEPEPEPEPVDEGPDILGKPKISLSIEDESPAGDTEAADQLDASLQGSDVAAMIAAYRKTLEESPDNLVMRTRLADLHLKYGMLEDALLQYRQVMRKNPNSISLLHRVIQAEFWTENFSEAGESLLALAKLHLKRGEHHDALDTLQSVLSLDSHHFEARKVLVSVFTTLDESKLAAHHLRQLAETALTKGEVSEAISAFQQLLEISNDPVFEERLAQIYESQGDMERALTSFQSLVGRYQAEERWEEAARVTERIVELNPELLEDRGSLVELYKKLGMEEKAMEQQFKLAQLYQNKGQLDRSIELYEGVLNYQKENQEARRLLVDAYLDSGNVESALQESESLTEFYLNTKDHQTAIELYSRLVEADPENVELQERLVKFYGLAGDPENAKARWIKISELHESRERFAKAADAIQKALELDEGQVELQHRLALLYAEKLDDKVAALTQLRKLFQAAPERLDAVKMYIDILLKEEQVSEAGQVLQQLEQAGGESLAIKDDVIDSLKNQVETNPTDLKARFNYGELCYHLGDLDHAIEQFQQTRRNPDYELLSYNMLGLCFAKKKGFNMLDLAIKQFKKGLETRGHSEQAYLELRYNLAMIQYQNGRITEALNDFKECYRVDITYRDVRSWIEKLESELASSGS